MHSLRATLHYEQSNIYCLYWRECFSSASRYLFKSPALESVSTSLLCFRTCEHLYGAKAMFSFSDDRFVSLA